MSKKAIFYHNITKHIFNISSLEELIEKMDVGDEIKKTVSGNAMVGSLSDQEFTELHSLLQNHIINEFHND
jgi:hypothetical protein